MIVQHSGSLANEIYKEHYNSYMAMKHPDIIGTKTADGWPALCYAHGIYDVPVLFNVHEQISFLRKNTKRTPSNVIEIGSGSGAVSCVLSHLGYNLDSVECNPSAAHFHRATNRRFFDCYPPDNHNLYICELNNYLTYSPTNIDTVILVESIEHIVPSEWELFFLKILPVLKQNNGHLIITNQKGYWPLGFDGDCPEHIALIDDNFYNNLTTYSKNVLYRDRSHICLEF